jgi:2-phosphoglycerate kinase
MKKYNYSDNYIQMYTMMNNFYTKRVPLIILISGPPLIGKSTLATKLSERMNISNVLQTKVVSDVMNSMIGITSPTPFWLEEEVTSDEELIRLYEKESMCIRKGVNYDIQKAFVEGKSIIIEGHHIIPDLYIDKKNGQIEIITPKSNVIEETEREKAVRGEMDSLKQHGIIIPFMLTTNEKEQLFLLKKGLFFKGENLSKNVIFINV